MRVYYREAIDCLKEYLRTDIQASRFDRVQFN